MRGTHRLADRIANGLGSCFLYSIPVGGVIGGIAGTREAFYETHGSSLFDKALGIGFFVPLGVMLGACAGPAAFVTSPIWVPTYAYSYYQDSTADRVKYD